MSSNRGDLILKWTIKACVGAGLYVGYRYVPAFAKTLPMINFQTTNGIMAFVWMWVVLCWALERPVRECLGALRSNEKEVEGRDPWVVDREKEAKMLEEGFVKCGTCRGIGEIRSGIQSPAGRDFSADRVLAFEGFSPHKIGDGTVDAILNFVVDHPQMFDVLFWIHVVSGIVVFLVGIVALVPLSLVAFDSWIQENVRYYRKPI